MKRPQQFLDYAAYLFVERVEPEAGPWSELQAKAGAPARLRKFAFDDQRLAAFEHQDRVQPVLSTVQCFLFTGAQRHAATRLL